MLEEPKKKNPWKIIAIIVSAIVFLFIIANVYKVRTSPENKIKLAANDGDFLSNGKCEGDKKPQITHLPMNESDFAYIIPYGMVIDNHVTPIDHQYFQPTEFNSAVNTYPVYAMADAKLVGIEKRTGYKGDFDIRLVFSMSCKLFYYYDLVTGLTPDIEKELGGKDYAAVDIPVKGGQQIGSIGGRTLDFAVWDMDVKLSGLLIPKHYQAEAWKIHTADPLLFYTDELKSKVVSKYIRTKEPISGKIDFDVDGKLIGTWFVEGSGGFGSLDNPSTDNYKGHFSIVPDHIDPTSFVISLGDYDGKPAQFGIKGNGPDPATIDVNLGHQKYELVQRSWVDENGKIWNQEHYAKGLKAANNTQVIGVVLIQMTEGRKIKLEVFPGKSAEDVNAFTSNVKIYER